MYTTYVLLYLYDILYDVYVIRRMCDMSSLRVKLITASVLLVLFRSPQCARGQAHDDDQADGGALNEETRGGTTRPRPPTPFESAAPPCPPFATFDTIQQQQLSNVPIFAQSPQDFTSMTPRPPPKAQNARGSEKDAHVPLAATEKADRERDAESPSPSAKDNDAYALKAPSRTRIPPYSLGDRGDAPGAPDCAQFAARYPNENFDAQRQGGYERMGTYPQSAINPHFGTYSQSGINPHFGAQLGANPQFRSYPQPGANPQFGSYTQLGAIPQFGSYPQPGAIPQFGSHPQPGVSPNPQFGSYAQTGSGVSPPFGSYSQQGATSALGKNSDSPSNPQFGYYPQPGVHPQLGSYAGSYAQQEPGPFGPPGGYPQPHSQRNGYARVVGDGYPSGYNTAENYQRQAGRNPHSGYYPQSGINPHFGTYPQPGGINPHFGSQNYVKSESATNAGDGNNYAHSNLVPQTTGKTRDCVYVTGQQTTSGADNAYPSAPNTGGYVQQQRTQQPTASQSSYAIAPSFPPLGSSFRPPLPPLNNCCARCERRCAASLHNEKSRAFVAKTKDGGDDGEWKASGCTTPALNAIIKNSSHMNMTQAKVQIQEMAENELGGGIFQVICAAAPLEFVTRSFVFCAGDVRDGTCYAFQTSL